MSKPSHPLVELTATRLREFLREPDALFWVFAFPLLMAIALGIAFRSERTQEVHVGVLAGPGSPELLRSFEPAPGIRARVLDRAEAERLLRNGEVAIVIVPGSPPAYRFDPTRPESQVARLTVDAALQRAAGRQDVWKARDEAVVVPGSRYIDWLLPGLLGMNIMGTGLWSIGFSVVLARMRKLLKRLVATPMPRGYYLLSHLLARLVFLVLEVAILLLAGWMIFGVRSAGPLWMVGLLCLLGAFSFAGLGLLIAARATTIEAISSLMNLAMVPMWILSGVFFASSNFPDAAQPFIKALPLTALNDALRAVMLEGRGLTGVVPEIANLTIWGVVTFGLALKLFRWR